MATTKKTPSPEDPQVQTSDSGELFEILTEDPNGHRTIHRERASSKTAAEKAVTDELRAGAKVLGVAVAGSGLGSGILPG